MIDTRAMIDASRELDRERALKVRQELRDLLRAWEDAMHLPHSFETKAERETRIAFDQRSAKQ